MVCRSGLTRGWDAWTPAFAGVTMERLGVLMSVPRLLGAVAILKRDRAG